MSVHSKRTFPEEWKVNFGDLSVETEDGFQVHFYYIPCQVSDNNHFGMWFFELSIFHVYIGITKRVR
jgi:hypothetical protein